MISLIPRLHWNETKMKVLKLIDSMSVSGETLLITDADNKSVNDFH